MEPERELEIWDIASGFNETGQSKGNPILCLERIMKTGSEGTIFILRDFHRFVDDPMVCRSLRNLSSKLKITRNTVIISAPAIKIPMELEDDIYVLDYQLPNYEEILTFVKALVEKFEIDETTLEALTKAFQGLTYNKIRTILSKALAKKGRIDLSDIELVLEEKKQIIKRSSILEFYPMQGDINSIGGLDELKQWVIDRSLAYTDKAKKYGLPYPKGMLLVGIQGTGKSLCAKAVANHWNMPLLKLDVGQLMGKYVGESESNAIQMIRTAEAMAPCTLWIDEIDKAFAGVSGYQGDAGTLSRVFGSLITWMQEKESPVFIVATANNIAQLPPELLRKGRFDEIFFVDLPNIVERRQIFYIHIAKKRGPGVKNYDIKRLASVSEGFSGAEIEQSVIDGMFKAFSENREFNTKDIELALQKTVPLSMTSKDKIKALQEWAKSGHARMASKHAGFELDPSRNELMVELPAN
jgi:SpoVK/Ycf46/Vps4 family AAA+-type ATPase